MFFFFSNRVSVADSILVLRDQSGSHHTVERTPNNMTALNNTDFNMTAIRQRYRTRSVTDLRRGPGCAAGDPKSRAKKFCPPHPQA
jgi:hypothetical protein